MKLLIVIFIIMLGYISLAQPPELVLPIGHNNRVEAAVFTPDGDMALTGSADGSIKFWNVHTGRLIKTIYAGVGWINSINISADGKTFVTSCSNGEAIIWNMRSGTMISKLEGHNSSIEDAIYSPNGTWIATSSRDGSIIVWNIKNKKYIIILDTIDVNYNFLDRKLSISFISNDKLAVLENSLFHSQLRIWKFEERKLIDTFSITPKGGIIEDRVLSISPDGSKMLIPFMDKSLRLYDIQSHQLLMNVKEFKSGFICARFSPNGNQAIAVTKDRSLVLFDMKTHKMLYSSDVGDDFPLVANLNISGSKIITGSEYGSVHIFNASNGEPLLRLQGSNLQKVQAVTYGKDLKNIITLSNKDGFPVLAKFWQLSSLVMTKNEIVEFNAEMEKNISINDAEIVGMKDGIVVLVSYSGKILKTYPFREMNAAIKVAFCPDKKSIMIGYWDGSIEVREKDSGEILWSYEGKGDRLFGKPLRIYDISFSKDGNYAVTASGEGTAKIWDLKSGRIKREAILVKEFKGHQYDVVSAVFSADGQKVATTSFDGTAKIWDVSSGELLQTLIGHKDVVMKSTFNDNGGKIVTTSNDMTNKLWDVFSGKELCTFFAINFEDYFTQIPAGYYQSTPAAARLLHYVTPDLKVITFDQLDIKYNRPDKVLEAIGCPDTALIRSYRLAYQKRIKKLGIDTTAFRDDYSVPEADFANRDSFTYDQTNATLSLRISGGDSAYALDRFNLWVNENPLFGLRGISLKGRGKHFIDTTIAIPLSDGKNTIETSVFNANGIESYRKPLYVNYTPKKAAQPQVYFVGIGIDSFARAGHDLHWSTADIRNLSDSLGRKFGPAFHQRTLLNRDVTTQNVLALKQWLADSTAINDKVIVAYSGHGLLSDSFDYFLSTYATDFEHPEKAGLPYDALESLLDNIPARKKLLLIDACHSGEVDKEELKRYEDNQAALAARGIYRGAQLVSYDTAGAHLGMKNAFELMQQLFVNVGRSTGATVISAAGGTQYAQEQGSLKSGVFTYAILEKLREGRGGVKVSELREYVGRRVTELTNGLQVPTTRSEATNADWEVW